MLADTNAVHGDTHENAPSRDGNGEPHARRRSERVGAGKPGGWIVKECSNAVAMPTGIIRLHFSAMALRRRRSSDARAPRATLASMDANRTPLRRGSDAARTPPGRRSDASRPTPGALGPATERLRGHKRHTWHEHKPEARAHKASRRAMAWLRCVAVRVGQHLARGTLALGRRSSPGRRSRAALACRRAALVTPAAGVVLLPAHRLCALSRPLVAVARAPSARPCCSRRARRCSSSPPGRCGQRSSEQARWGATLALGPAPAKVRTSSLVEALLELNSSALRARQ